MKCFIFCIAFVHYSGIILCTEINKANSSESSKYLSDIKNNEIESENADIVGEFCEKYDFCALINKIKDVQERLDIHEMKKYANFTCVKLLNILKELLNESKKLKDLTIYSYVYNFLSNSIYLIEMFLTVYKNNLHYNCKFPQEAIKRVSINFEHVDRLFFIIENLINEERNYENYTKFGFIRTGVLCLKENIDVLAKIFNRCKTPPRIDYQNHNSLIIKQLTELQEQLKKIKNSISVTSEFKIINHAELFKKDFVNSVSDFYKNLIECYQNDIEALNFFFETLENILNGTGKSIDELESYKEMLSMQ